MRRCCNVSLRALVVSESPRNRCGCEVLESLCQVDCFATVVPAQLDAAEVEMSGPNKPRDALGASFKRRRMPGSALAIFEYPHVNFICIPPSRCAARVHEQVSFTLLTTQTHHTTGFATTGAFAGGTATSSPKSDAK